MAEGKASKRPKAPRALERDILEHGPAELVDLVTEWDAWEADVLTQELFAQRRRVADAERALQARDTKKAREDVRVGTNKVAIAQRRLGVLKGKPSDQDLRIYPGVHCPVLVSEGGRPVRKPWQPGRDGPELGRSPPRFHRSVGRPESGLDVARE